MMNRRNVLKAAGILPSLAALYGAAQTRRDNCIVAENSNSARASGSSSSRAFDNPLTLASYPLNRDIRSSVIEGYASKTSVLPGQSIDFMVSMRPAGSFKIAFYRMGYYGDTGGRHMLTLGPFKAEPQPVPMMTIERLRECAWPKSASLTIPEDWPSGVYLGKLTRDESFGWQSYVRLRG